MLAPRRFTPGTLGSLGALAIACAGTSGPSVGSPPNDVPASGASVSRGGASSNPGRGEGAAAHEPPEAANATPVAAGPALSWSCLEPPRARVAVPPRGEVIRSPRAGQTFRLSDVGAVRVSLRLPRLGEGRLRAMIALDHHPGRPARVEMPLSSLTSAWEPIEPGTHRLAVYWLDEGGLPVRSSLREVLVVTSDFVVEAPRPLGAGDWLLVSPAGTLNGEPPAASGHPFGLSLVHLGEGRGEATLEISGGGVTHRGAFGPGDCALAIERSGDYQVWLSAGGERTLVRTVTVNRDLEPRRERPTGQ